MCHGSGARTPRPPEARPPFCSASVPSESGKGTRKPQIYRARRSKQPLGPLKTIGFGSGPDPSRGFGSDAPAKDSGSGASVDNLPTGNLFQLFFVSPPHHRLLVAACPEAKCLSLCFFLTIAPTKTEKKTTPPNRG